MQYSEDDLGRARELINCANAYAISSYVPLLDNYPEIKSIAESNLLQFWDYLVTITCVGVAFMEIADTVPDKDQQGICYALRNGLTEWQPESYNIMADFLFYVNNSLDAGAELPTTIGNWIWANLETHKKANIELRKLASSSILSKVVGLQVLIAFHNWWKGEN